MERHHYLRELEALLNPLGYWGLFTTESAERPQLLTTSDVLEKWEQVDDNVKRDLAAGAFTAGVVYGFIAGNQSLREMWARAVTKVGENDEPVKYAGTVVEFVDMVRQALPDDGDTAQSPSEKQWSDLINVCAGQGFQLTLNDVATMVAIAFAAQDSSGEAETESA